MSGPVILSCALTGGSPESVNKSQYVPRSPQQIADQALEAEQEGAAIAHIHVRDPESGAPSVKVEYYEEVVDRIRSARSKLIINLSTGAGGLFRSRQDGEVGFEPHPGSNPPMSPYERVEHVLRCKPDICSLDIATLNFGFGMQMINDPEHLAEMAGLIHDAGVKPELEVFDLGHLTLALDLFKRGVLKTPAFFQFCLGIPFGAPALPETVSLMRSMIPKGSVWSAFAIGSAEFQMAAIATSMGGHIRVGLEDNLYSGRGQLAKSNAELVTKANNLIFEMGFSLATPEEARNILGL